MKNAEKPIFLVAVRDEFMSFEGLNYWNALPAFGTIACAQRFINELPGDTPKSLFRIVEYKFTGNIMEGGDPSVEDER